MELTAIKVKDGLSSRRGKAKISQSISPSSKKYHFLRELVALEEALSMGIMGVEGLVGFW